jgi:hypothetical protein
MRKLVVMLAVTALATTAFGATLNMNFVAGLGGPDIGDTIILGPTDVAWFALWLHLDPSETLGQYSYALNTNPPVVEDFTWDSFEPGPYITEYSDPVLYGWNLNIWEGGGFYYVGPPDFPYPHGPVDVVIATFDIHCTGIPSETLIFNDGAYSELIFYQSDFLTQLPVDYTDANMGITVIQIPEPASLTLLALGGLALIRRR